MADRRPQPALVADGGRTRIAFAMSGDPGDPVAYSGAPFSLVNALRASAVSILPVNADLPPAARRLAVNLMAFTVIDRRTLASELRATRNLRLAVRAHKPRLETSALLTTVRSLMAARGLDSLAGVERAIQFGSDFRLPKGTDYVTLDDATLAQLVGSYPYPWMQNVPQKGLRAMIDRQQAIFRGARACCLLSHWAARSAVDDYGVPPARVHVVGTGTNRSVSATPRAWDVPRFLFVGIDFQRKNGQGVLDAFRVVREQHPGATLDVVGGHPPIDQPGVTTHGILRLDHPEEISRLNSLFAAATCLVMPSLLEPTGNVHAEALAAGIGSIGTTAGGVGTIIGDTGITVEPTRRGALINAMLTFCDPEVMREYGRRAELRAPLFTWRAVAQRILRSLQLPSLDPASLAEFL